MSLTIVLVLVVVFSFGVGHLATRYASRFVALSGAEYIIVGVLIGPQFPPRLVSAEVLVQLGPVVSLLLGLMGFVLGLRARGCFEKLNTAVVGAGFSIAMLLTIGIAFLPLLGFFLPVDASLSDFVIQRDLGPWGDGVLEILIPSEHLYLAIGFGAAACVCSAAAIETSKRLLGARGRVVDLLRTTATMSQIVAVLALGFTLASLRATDSAEQLSIGVTEWQFAAVGFGVVCGLLFGLFIGREDDPKRIFIASVGAVTFASGIGSALGISPMFVNLLAGVTVAITSPHAPRLRDELNRLEHPLFVLIMIFGGAVWTPVSGALWVLPLSYVVLRFFSLRVFMRAASRTLLSKRIITERLGNGLLAQGSLAVAIGINFAQRFPEFGSVILTTVLAGMLVSDLFSARALKAILLDAGEAGEAPPASSGPTSTPAAEARA